ncbi:Rv3235 family protein [Streptomyces sp. NPDC048275]|uniref:Rv3235 family protein n=1 Tax=Streptomyces sp. NPDC048275 TaxID=3155629 RepID=UPI0033F945C6
MNKVMTRTKRHPGARPPGRHDTRRPGSTPSRAPGTGTPRPTPGEGPPPSPSAADAFRTAPPGTRHLAAAPTAGRPPTAPTTAPPPAPSPTGAPPLTRPATPPRGPAPQPRPTDLFADRLLAVLSGHRPVHCMLRHTAGRAYDELAWLAERGPLRARGTRPVVRDIGYDVPRPGAIEAFARIGAGDQLRAMAFRLEQGPDLRWRCTAVELGGPRMPRPDDD